MISEGKTAQDYAYDSGNLKIIAVFVEAIENADGTNIDDVARGGSGSNKNLTGGTYGGVAQEDKFD